MMDGVFAGLLGGLFGPGLAAWMSGFKYQIVFLSVTLATYGCLFLNVLIRNGPSVAFEKLVSYGLAPSIILTSMGIGLLAVLVAFMGSLAVVPKDNDSEGQDKQER